MCPVNIYTKSWNPPQIKTNTHKTTAKKSGTFTTVITHCSFFVKFRENTGSTHSTEKSQQHTIYSIGIGHTGKCVF